MDVYTDSITMSREKILHSLYAAPACDAGAAGSVSMATGESTASSEVSLITMQNNIVSFESTKEGKKENAKTRSIRDS